MDGDEGLGVLDFGYGFPDGCLVGQARYMSSFSFIMQTPLLRNPNSFF